MILTDILRLKTHRT